LVLAIPAYFEGSFSYRFGGILAIFTPIVPIALLIGPLCQWLITRSVGHAFKEIVKICVGWIFATFLPFLLFYLINLMEPIVIIDSFTMIVGAMMASGILSGVVLALATERVFRPIEGSVSVSFHS
jgi:hypothetical protein